FLRNTGQHVGFSVGVAQVYTPGVGSLSGRTNDLTFTSIVPQAYTNVHKKNLEFRMIYGIVYKRYNGELSALNRVSQNGNLSFSYTASRRKTTWQVSNVMTSAYYDEGSFLTSGFLNVAVLGLTPQTYFDRRRET